MPIARYKLIDQDKPGYYHVYSRCVQQERLCGYDPKTKRDYSYRKEYMVERLRLLTSVFPVDGAAYAIMDDHYHLNLFHNPQRVANWDDETIVKLWLTIHEGPTFMRRWYKGKSLTDQDRDQVQPTIDQWRCKLKSLSYFMKCFNEKLSKKFNKEFDKRGAFWESRFQIKEMTCNKDLLLCMSYVDLNPVHAGIVNTPEEAPYTSFRKRKLQADLNSQIANSGLTNPNSDSPNNAGTPAQWLMPFKDQVSHDQTEAYIEFTYNDYCELVYWLGQAQRDDKKGAIKQQANQTDAADRPAIVDKLGIDAIDLQLTAERMNGRGWLRGLTQ